MSPIVHSDFYGSQMTQIQEWLSDYVYSNHGVAGTVHVRQDEDLRLAAALNIPEVVQNAVRAVPRGKGMAGIAFERGEPVYTCNLQEGSSAEVRPGARAVDAAAAVALPVSDAAGRIVAVVGIAFVDERQFDRDELARLNEAAKNLIGFLNEG